MLKIIKSKKHDRNRSIGWFVLAVIDHFMVHGYGPVVGEKVNLVRETQQFIVDCYALDENGKRLYGSAFFSRPKGFAKSEMAAFIAIIEACFPCRFDHWAEEGETWEWGGFAYAFEKGEPVPRYVKSPFVRLLATEEDQITKGIYATIYYNLTPGNSPLGDMFSNADVQRSLIRVPWTDGQIMPSTSSGSSKDGGKETFVVFDETHLYDSDSLRTTYSIVQNNLKKLRDSEPWGLETSTMFEPGAESVAERTYEAALVIEEDERVASDHMDLYFNHRQGPEDIDFGIYDEVKNALIEAYGDFAPYVDIDRLTKGFFDVRTTLGNQKRFYLNQIAAADDSWVQPAAWNQCALTEEDYETDPLVHGDEIAIAFDGSKGRDEVSKTFSGAIADSTALVGVRLRDGLVFILGLWEQPEGKLGLGWKPPRDEINERVKEVFDNYKVKAFYADPSYWEKEVAQWEQKYRRQLRVKAARMRPIAWTFSDGARVAKAIDLTKEAMLEQEIKHCNQDALGKHVRNARAVKKRYGTALYKPVGHDERKIDAAVTLVMAWQARIDALSYVSIDGADRKKNTVSAPRLIRR